MAAPRNLSPAQRLAYRAGAATGKPGSSNWSQAAMRLNLSGFQPSWSRKSGAGVTESTLRDLFVKPRPGRLNAQIREQRRAEINRYVASQGINRQKFIPITKAQGVSRQRKVANIQHSKEDALTRPSVYVGQFDISQRKAPTVSRTEIVQTISEAYRVFPIADAMYNVRIHVEVKASDLPGTAWESYGEAYSEHDEESGTTRKGVLYQRIILSINVHRSDIDSAAQRASAEGLRQWQVRFIEILFGVRPARVLGFGIVPLDWQGAE